MWGERLRRERITDISIRMRTLQTVTRQRNDTPTPSPEIDEGKEGGPVVQSS